MEEALRELGVLEVRELRQLREENAWLKRLIANLTLDRHVLQEVIKKRLASDSSSGQCTWIYDCFQLSIRRCCKLGCLRNATLSACQMHTKVVLSGSGTINEESSILNFRKYPSYPGVCEIGSRPVRLLGRYRGMK